VIDVNSDGNRSLSAVIAVTSDDSRSLSAVIAVNSDDSQSLSAVIGVNSPYLWSSVNSDDRQSLSVIIAVIRSIKVSLQSGHAVRNEMERLTFRRKDRHLRAAID
jgi:hypothetical protein